MLETNFIELPSKLLLSSFKTTELGFSNSLDKNSTVCLSETKHERKCYMTKPRLTVAVSVHHLPANNGAINNIISIKKTYTNRFKILLTLLLKHLLQQIMLN